MEFLQDLWSLSKTIIGIFSLVTYLIRILRIFRLFSQKTVIRPSAPTPSPHCSQLERLAAVNIPAWRKLHKIQADFYRFFKSCMLCTFFHFNAFVWLQFKKIPLESPWILWNPLETPRIPRKPQESPLSFQLRILNNDGLRVRNMNCGHLESSESLGIPQNPLESPRIPLSPLESPRIP